MSKVSVILSVYLTAHYLALCVPKQRTPCDLSVLLLTELKEIIKTYCQSPAGAKNSKKTSHTFCKVTTTLFLR
jgi:hypothetical protein